MTVGPACDARTKRAAARAERLQTSYELMSDGSGKEGELAHQRHHSVDAHALAGSAVDHHRLRRAVEDPHRVGASNVVTGDDGEGASDVRVAPDDAPHDDRVTSVRNARTARGKN